MGTKRISPEDRVIDYFLATDLSLATNTFNIVKRVLYNRQQHDIAPVGVSFKVPAKRKRHTKAELAEATLKQEGGL